LSPILFIVYIDELIVKLKESGVGCHIGPYFVGALGYADDLTLLSPSLRSLNTMLNICHNFAQEFNITFNVKKTMCIKYGSDVKDHEQVFLNGVPLKWVKSVKHLGNYITSNLDDNCDCNFKKGMFNSSVNKLLATYGSLYKDNLLYLFRTYCCSFYGSELWDFKSVGFKSCCTQWNKAVRKILGLPFNTHTWLLGPLSGQTHVSVQFYLKTFKFIYNMLYHVNPTVSFLARLAHSNAQSPLGRNISLLRHLCHVDFCQLDKTNIIKIKNMKSLSSEQLGLASVCREILYDCPVYNFDDNMLNCILVDICAN